MAKEIVFNVFCSGVYQTHLIVDDDFCGDNLNEMSDEEFERVRRYVCEHLDEANVGDIEWIADIDVDADDIKAIYEVDY